MELKESWDAEIRIRMREDRVHERLKTDTVSESIWKLSSRE
jgi:hypothetical protein